MTSLPIARRLFALASAALFTLTVGHTDAAQDRTSGATLFVTVLPDRYLSDGVVFPDLDALAALVVPARPTWLVLEHCGAPATDALLAAAEHFRNSALRIVPADAQRCADAARRHAMLLTQASGSLPTRPAATPDMRYWNQLMP